MEPYSWLMFDIYGGGNQTYNGVFIMTATACSVTVRLSRAGSTTLAAANLNCWVELHLGPSTRGIRNTFGRPTTASVLIPDRARDNQAAFAAYAGRAVRPSRPCTLRICLPTVSSDGRPKPE